MHIALITAALAVMAGATPEESEALKDAASSLMLPCSAEQATGKLTRVRVVDGKEMNKILEKEKSKRPKADPQARFLAVTYVSEGRTLKDYRQISTRYGLTSEQAQALIGEKVCEVSY
jgi:hypothetical protein